SQGRGRGFIHCEQRPVNPSRIPHVNPLPLTYMLAESSALNRPVSLYDDSRLECGDMSPHSKNPGHLSNFYVYKTVSAKGAAFTASLGQRPGILAERIH